MGVAGAKGRVQRYAIFADGNLALLRLAFMRSSVQKSGRTQRRKSQLESASLYQNGHTWTTAPHVNKGTKLPRPFTKLRRWRIVLVAALSKMRKQCEDTKRLATPQGPLVAVVGGGCHQRWKLQLR